MIKKLMWKIVKAIVISKVIAAITETKTRTYARAKKHVQLKAMRRKKSA